MSYSIYLDGTYLGETEFEHADAPMGVVMGKIKVKNSENIYTLIKDYCEQKKYLLKSIPNNIGLLLKTLKI